MKNNTPFYKRFLRMLVALSILPFVFVFTCTIRFILDIWQDGVPRAFRILKSDLKDYYLIPEMIAWSLTGIDYPKMRKYYDYRKTDWCRFRATHPESQQVGDNYFEKDDL